MGGLYVTATLQALLRSVVAMGLRLITRTSISELIPGSSSCVSTYTTREVAPGCVKTIALRRCEVMTALGFELRGMAL